MGVQKIKQKKNRSGKVVDLFIVEITDASSAPELYANPNNPYAQMSDDERAKEFDSIFGLLLAESYRENGRDIKEENGLQA